MKILAIETSCDDTSISICDKNNILSLKTFSQIKEHNKFGGVIPELASRLHSKHIYKMINLALEDSNLSLKEIEAIVYTKGPGLINTLQVGMIVAKTLSQLLDIPFYGLNHLDAHIYSPFIGKNYTFIPKKGLFLVVSGGHTILGIKNNSNLKILGQTKDDSIGEAYDKVAKMLKLNYPGGPVIDDIYNNFNGIYNEIGPKIELSNYDFSYSGLKSWVSKEYKNFDSDFIATRFQDLAIEQLITKLKKAIVEYKVNNIIIGGGVSANSLLRKKLKEIEKNYNVEVYFPKKIYATDNAAMIGYLFYVMQNINKKLVKSKLNEDCNPNLIVGEI